MSRTEDALELLLPGSHATDVQRARKVTHFLRLLSDDAQPRRACSVGIDFERARGELERQDRECLDGALVDLLRHHLAIPGESLLWLGEPELELQEAWQLLGEFRSTLPWLAGVPAPDETSLEVADRLLASLERAGADPHDVALWRARAVHAGRGPRVAERLFRSAFDAASATCAGARVTRLLAASVAECLLDRGAVRDARTWLFEHAALVGSDARLRQLLAWTRLCLGDHAGAQSALSGLRPWTGPLPLPLADLRAHRPEWLACLAGRAADGRERARSAAHARAISDRTDVGAAVLGVFALRRDHSAHPLLLDVAPALRPAVEGWLAEREGACALPSEREHRLVVRAELVVAHRDADAHLVGSLGRETTAALALSPILDDDGEVAGWLYVECEHHLLPSALRLGELARAWRDAVLAAPVVAIPAHGSIHASGTGAVRRGGAGAPPCAVPSVTRTSDAVESLQPSGDVRARAVFEDLIAELGMKMSQRRWWGFAVEGRSPTCVAHGGEGAGLCERPTGRQAALRRALITGGTVHFEEPDERLAIQAEAGSGLVLPLFAGARICGLLAIESSRRRDFRPADVARCADIVERAGLALRLAQFRTWHRERFGFDVWFDAFRPDFRIFADHLLAAARARAAVVFAGPAGAGKQVLARWLHFESAHADGPLQVHTCGIEGRRVDWSALTAGQGSLVLDGVDQLSPVLQDAWLGELDGIDLAGEADETGADRIAASGTNGGARVFATTRVGLAGGVLRPDLAARLNRLQLVVPPLADRREDLLPLIACLSRRFAEEEGLRAPQISDEALALLWRQRWEGNVRELENLVYKLVLLNRASRGRAGEVLSCEHVAEVARRFQVELVRRLPSRHPQRSDLLGALRTTRKVGGRLNKTRAALYLGWDPDTLVARMQEAGIDEASLEADSAWWAGASAIAAPDPE